MEKELSEIKIKMRALGLSGNQIEMIIGECLHGRRWAEMNAEEKREILQSLDSRIAFARTFFKFLNCKTCWK